MNELILSFFEEGNKMKGTTLYHLLRGRRTNSVLVYGFFHGVLPYLGAFPKLDESLIKKILAYHCSKGFLKEDKGEYLLTDKGRRALEKNPFRFPEIDYFSFGKTAHMNWRLVKFAIQVVSYFSYSENEYLPIETSPYYTIQVKNWLRQQERKQLSVQIKTELTATFQQLSDTQAAFLSNQFSGRQIDGAVAYQLLPDSMQEFPYNQLFEDEAIHAFFRCLKELPESALYELVKEGLKQNYNQSVRQTIRLFLQGATKEQVMQVRHIKESTINDHLIEWAILDEAFPFQQFISKETEEQLCQLNSPILTWQYREINQRFSLSYDSFRLFQIREYRKKGRK